MKLKTPHPVAAIFTRMSRRRQDELLLWQAAEALRLTREYVYEEMLPPVEGWSWFDAYCAIAARFDDDGMHCNIGRWVDDYQRRDRKRAAATEQEHSNRTGGE